MKAKVILTIAFGVCSVMVALSQAPAGQAPAAQGQRQGPGVQGPNDPRYAALIATCKNPPPARGGGGQGRGGAAPAAAPGQGAPAPAGAQARGAGQAAPAPARGAAPAGPVEYTVTEIPGVIAAGQRWKTVWETQGNNADGIVGTDDGAVLIAQNDNSAVVRLDKDGKVTTAYSDTNTGGALSMNSKGALFVASRALNAGIVQLAPQRRILANTYQGDPLDCIGGVLNDLTADSKGGVYFTMSGLYYANPSGVVTKYGENLQTNGLILSADEKTLYVTNGQSLAAFDVQPDGSLRNQREFVAFQGGGGDGATIDSAGRIYVTGRSGIQVVGPDGKSLGLIPTPRGVITTAFSGPDKKTLYAVISLGQRPNQSAEVIAIQMVAQGYKGRAK